MSGIYCQRCDLFSGFSSLAVFTKPDRSHAWLETHCWACGDSERHLKFIAYDTMPPELTIDPVTITALRAAVLSAHLKHGKNSMLNVGVDSSLKLAALVEEFGEVCELYRSQLLPDRVSLVKELLQVANCGISWFLSIEYPVFRIGLVPTPDIPSNVFAQMQGVCRGQFARFGEGSMLGENSDDFTRLGMLGATVGYLGHAFTYDSEISEGSKLSLLLILAVQACLWAQYVDSPHTYDHTNKRTVHRFPVLSKDTAASESVPEPVAKSSLGMSKQREE